MKYIYLGVILFMMGCGIKQNEKLQIGKWQAKLLREDGNNIVFNFEVISAGDSLRWIIKNGKEQIEVNDISIKGDSVFVAMPVFESYFKLIKKGNDQLTGIWTKAATAGFIDMPFEAVAGTSKRFETTNQPIANISGKWEVTFFRADGSPRPAIAEFVQQGETLSGTFITPTGDYRYLYGVVDGNQVKLSTFDGSHAYYFNATINSDTLISNGNYYSGATSIEPWKAVKNEQATLPDVAAMFLKEGEEKLSFSFPDLDGNQVSINDERFKNKVVIVQIMGSWCPNCMDETAFLSDYYQKNKDKGVEVVALAYEYYEDRALASNSVRKFQKRFNVQYPMLLTGVTVSDTLRTEKTLPQLTKIKSFPSTIFIDKQGKVAKIHAGFEGPGTGVRYELLKKEFEATVERLLK
jgi:thiol-disulfide isomerase/thioredoxin